MNSLPKIEHKAISASAGSGKTFKLTHRFIRLLTLGVQPDRILALTFSRKAAGEIFEALIKHLCNAIQSETERVVTCREIGIDPDSDSVPAIFLDCLRALIDSLHRLRIGTLDSFIIKILKLFPMELGIAPNLRMMDEGGWESDALRRELLYMFLSPRTLDDQQRGSFLADYEHFTGGEEKQVFKTLSDMIGQWHERYLMNAEESAWGAQNTIWPHGAVWQSEKDINAAKEILREWNEKEVPRGKNYSGYINELIEQVDGHSSYYRFGDRNRIRYFFGKFENIPELFQSDSCDLKLGSKEMHLEGREFQALIILMMHVLETNLNQLQKKTKGIYGLIDSYEAAYRDAIERTGCLSFIDSQLLLDTESTRFCGTPLHSGEARPSLDRLDIDFRLDGQIDHWLLDEFQDTSDVQWGCIKSLAEEVLMDAEGRRSFFYVGDVKQAIYSWRRGNPDLFRQISESYSNEIVIDNLSKSWRSSPAVIAAVNRVFENIVDTTLPTATTQKWSEIWRTHETAKSDLSGSVELLQALEEDCGNGREEDRRQARHEVVASLVETLRPTARGLSTAILVRKNSEIAGIVDTLRQRCPSVPVVHEGPAEILDEPAAVALLNILQYAIHPYDKMARAHLLASPLREFIESDIDGDSFCSDILAQFQSQGAHSFLLEWIGKLEKSGAIGRYERERLGGLERAAAEFDSSTPPRPEEFIRYAQYYKHRHPSTSSAIRVMTIHQSKGLEFDIVILPELEGGRSIEKKHDLDFIEGVKEQASRPDWYLSLSARMDAACDTTLSNALAGIDARQAFENLCLLYVAMTRAIHGLYIVTSHLDSRSKVFNYAKFLQKRLGLEELENVRCEIDGEFHAFERSQIAGSNEWYNDKKAPDHKVEDTPASPCIPKSYPQRKSSRIRPVQITPSVESEEQETTIRSCFQTQNKSTAFGSAIHELFSQLEWIDDIKPEELAQKWKSESGFDPEISEKVVAQFMRNLSDTTICRIFQKPESRTQLWLEKGFEALHGNDWISGAFDRVVIHHNDADQPIRADLIDFKSNRIDDEQQLDALVSKHRPQLQTYRLVLSKLLNLKPDAISAKIIYTYCSRLREI